MKSYVDLNKKTFDYYINLYRKLNESFTNFNVIINQQNDLKTKYLRENQKYKNFTEWLRNNGAIYESSLNYPVAFGPFGLVGVSAKEDIDNYKSMFYVPKKIIIDSTEVKYRSFISLLFLHKESKFIKESNILVLTIFLLFENLKKENSFFKPYIDMVDVESPLFWDDCQLNLLDDAGIVDAINFHNEEIKEYFIQIINFLKKNIIEKEYEKYITEIEEHIETFYSKSLNQHLFTLIKEYAITFLDKINLYTFKTFYNFVLSRNFMLNDNISQLVPLADSLNHSEVDVYYEYFDSNNYVSKYTLEFDENFVKKIQKTNHDLYYSSINNFQSNDELYKVEKTNSFNLQVKKINELVKNGHNISQDELRNSNLVNENKENNITMEFNESDYFTICTGPKQKYLKNKQVFNFYGRYSNEYLISNYGFTNFLNKYDKLKFTMNYEKNDDYIFEKMIEFYFSKYYQIHPQYIIIKFKLKLKKINNKFIDFLRFLIVYEEIEDENELYKISEIKNKLDLKLEIKVLKRALEILVSTLKQKNQKFSINDDLMTLNKIYSPESQINESESKNFQESNKSREISAISFRITQKFIVLSNIKFLNLILRVLSSSNEDNISIEEAFKLRFYEFEENDSEYEINRKFIRKYFLKNKIFV